MHPTFKSVLCGLQFPFTHRHRESCPLKSRGPLASLAETNRQLFVEVQRSRELREKIKNSESAKVLAGIVDMLEGQVGGKVGPGMPKPPKFNKKPPEDDDRPKA